MAGVMLGGGLDVWFIGVMIAGSLAVGVLAIVLERVVSPQANGVTDIHRTGEDGAVRTQ
ncbi:MAG: hypothetical protein ACRDT7_05640 [Microbacterium sp.]